MTDNPQEYSTKGDLISAALRSLDGIDKSPDFTLAIGDLLGVNIRKIVNVGKEGDEYWRRPPWVVTWDLDRDGPLDEFILRQRDPEKWLPHLRQVSNLVNAFNREQRG